MICLTDLNICCATCPRISDKHNSLVKVKLNFWFDIWKKEKPTCCSLLLQLQNVSEDTCPWSSSRSRSLLPPPRRLLRSLPAPPDGACPCPQCLHGRTDGDCPQSFQTANRQKRDIRPMRASGYILGQHHEWWTGESELETGNLNWWNVLGLTNNTFWHVAVRRERDDVFFYPNHFFLFCGMGTWQSFQWCPFYTC